RLAAPKGAVFAGAARRQKKPPGCAGGFFGKFVRLPCCTAIPFLHQRLWKRKKVKKIGNGVHDQDPSTSGAGCQTANRGDAFRRPLVLKQMIPPKLIRIEIIL